MKKRKQNRAERTRKKRARREEKRNVKGTMTMAEKKIATIEQIRAHMKKKEYAEVINTFADMLEQGNPPEECFGDVARAYFELGDYTRAASWVTNTLSKEPSNIEIRMLLARICQREKRADDALKLYEHILAVYSKALSDEQREELKRLARLDAQLHPDQTRAAYPHIADLLGLGTSVEAAAAPSPAVPASAASPRVGADLKKESVDAAAMAAEILGKQIRPQEKCRALNAFAGVAYMDGDYAGAKLLLMETIQLDPGNIDALRNMALLLHEMGDHEKAIALAAKMRKTDFLLLRALKS